VFLSRVWRKTLRDTPAEMENGLFACQINNNTNLLTYIELFTYSDQKHFTGIIKIKIMLCYIYTKTSYNQ